MIKKIVLKDIASYDHNGVTFADLQKVNFIYGGNGTGKTTLSRVLGSRNREEDYPNCELEWENGEPCKVLVYNRNFRERNLKENIPGIFLLGGGEWEYSVEPGMTYQDRIEKGRKTLNEYREKTRVTEKEIEREEKRLQDILWEMAYQPNKEFEECLKDYNRKVSFTERIRTILKGKRYTLKQAEIVERDYLLEQYNICHRNKNNGRFVIVRGGNHVEMTGPELNFRRQLLEEDLWLYLASLCEEEVACSEKVLFELGAKLREYRIKEEYMMLAYSQIKPDGIVEEQMTTTVKPVVEMINKTLLKFGITNFTIKPSPKLRNHYQIQREDGTLAYDTLSEGESTIISFLYFIYMARLGTLDCGLDTKKVVVIDDPISSLDSDVMFMVRSLVSEMVEQTRLKTKEKPGGLEQLLVLTHHKSFYQSISSRQKRKDTHYWVLSKRNGISMATAYGQENPIRGEYEELWFRLRQESKNANSVMMQNLMRRILEEYFVKNGGYDKHKLFAGEYTKTEEDRLAVKSLAKWFDEGSHGVMEDIFFNTSEDRYMEVFR